MGEKKGVWLTPSSSSPSIGLSSSCLSSFQDRAGGDPQRPRPGSHHHITWRWVWSFQSVTIIFYFIVNCHNFNILLFRRVSTWPCWRFSWHSLCPSSNWPKKVILKSLRSSRNGGSLKWLFLIMFVTQIIRGAQRLYFSPKLVKMH